MFRLALVFLIGVHFSTAALPIRIESFSCYGNSVYCTNVTCSMGIIREKMQVLNFDCIFLEEMDDLTIRFTLFKKEGGKFKVFNIDSKEDLCKVLDKTERSNIVSRMMPMWKYYGHFPDSCPVKGEVSVRRYPMDLAFYPSVFPGGDFKIVIQILHAQNISILNVATGFSIKY